MILTGLLNSIRHIAPSSEITIFSANPEETRKKHAVNSVEKFPAGFRSTVKYIFGKKLNKAKIKAADYVIIGGGGLFASVSKTANFIWGIQALKAYKLKKPVIMYGQSLGEIKGRFLKFFLRKIFQKSIFIAVRDQNSKEALKKIGVRKKIHLMSDLAFKINPISKGTIAEKKIVISLRYLQNFPSNLKENLINFCNWLIEEKKFKLTFVDFGILEGDTMLHQEIISEINKKSSIRHLSDSDLNQIFNEFQSAHMVIGMRLHSVITSIITNTPFIAISYSSKVANLLETLGLEQYCLDMQSCSELRSLYEKIASSRAKIISKLEKINSDAEHRHLEVEKQLQKILSGASNLV